jgi:hypothetical protein
MSVMERKKNKYDDTLLAFLLDEEKFFIRTNKLSSDGYFSCTIENIFKGTSLSRYKQDETFLRLQPFGVISTIVCTMPARRYFKINHDKVKSHFPRL